jgi:hypothetical protein
VLEVVDRIEAILAADAHREYATEDGGVT